MTEKDKPKLSLKLKKPIDVLGLREAYLKSQTKEDPKQTLGSKQADVLTREEIDRRLKILENAKNMSHFSRGLANKIDEDITEVPSSSAGVDPVVNNDSFVEHSTKDEETIILPLDIQPAELKKIGAAELAKEQIEDSTKAPKNTKHKPSRPSHLEVAERPRSKPLPSYHKHKKVTHSGTKIVREITIGETIRVGDLANAMAVRASDVLKELVKLGMPANVDQVIKADVAELLVSNFGHHFKQQRKLGIEDALQRREDSVSLVARPPVVTLMGHVDHGKTSLLDALCLSKAASTEAGGITQHVRAYSVKVDDKHSITFIDTPGHEAFTAMRGRGAKVTDIIILVVAADDSVKAQTIEAISHAKAAGVPIIVAINKVDKHNINIDKVKQDLLNYDLVAEEFGGQVTMVPVSAQRGDGLELLKEHILLLAEVLELKANFKGQAKGVVIESSIDKNRGVMTKLLVQNGCLEIGNIIVAGGVSGKVRAMYNDKSTIKQASPSIAVEVLGLPDVVSAGDKFLVTKNDKEAREIAEHYRNQALELKSMAKVMTSEEHFLQSISEDKKAKLPIILKTDTQGSLEAITNSISKIEHTEVQLQLVHSAVGNINTSDISLATAAGALIAGFNVKTAPDASQKAKNNNIDIRHYNIIYNIIDDIKLLLSGLLSPISKEEYLGSAEVRQLFNVSKVGVIAGSYVLKGLMRRAAYARLIRQGAILYQGKISTLRRFKEDVKDVKENFECGIALDNYEDIRIGDVIEAYDIVKEQQYIS